MILRAAEVSLFLDGKHVEKHRIANLRRAGDSWCSTANPRAVKHWRNNRNTESSLLHK